MCIKIALILSTIFTAFFIFSCASSMANLGSARINKGNNFLINSQFRHIEHHSNYKGEGDWHGDPYDRTANSYGINYSYGFFIKNIGFEVGLKTGWWQHFHWHYQDGSSTDYFPYVCIDTEGAEIFRQNPYIKIGINQQKPLKMAFVVELPAAGFIASYDIGNRFTPYFSGRLSLTKYENPVGYHWRTGVTYEGEPYSEYEPEEEENKIAFLPALGFDIRISNGHFISFESGLIPDYYKNDNLYVFGFGLNL